jgi:hypothetical protein
MGIFHEINQPAIFKGLLPTEFPPSQNYTIPTTESNSGNQLRLGTRSEASRSKHLWNPLNPWTDTWALPWLPWLEINTIMVPLWFGDSNHGSNPSHKWVWMCFFK